MDSSIASAVVLPEESVAPASPSRSLKRRQSSVSEDSTKRARLSEGDGNAHGQGISNSIKPAPSVRREKGRERRLFGAVLGALSRNPTSATQQRRSEIENRQLARRRQQDDESEQRKSERIARRRAQRAKEQENFDGETVCVGETRWKLYKREIDDLQMRVRHDNILNMAHFLRTKTEPHLLYKPWETSPEEDECIRTQLADARDTIEKEMQDYETHCWRATNGDRRNSIHRETDTAVNYNSDVSKEPPMPNGETDRDAISPVDIEMEDRQVENGKTEAANNEHTIQNAQNSTTSGHDTSFYHSSKDSADDNGEDVVEEAAEDTVIY